MRRLLVGFGLIAAALFFSSAAGADQITAIQVAPASPQAGQNATVTLQGLGTCSGLVFDWGDQSPTYSHGNQFTLPFPLPSHTYVNAGSYTLTVTGVNGCVGKNKQTSITVAKKTTVGIIDLCKKVDCTGLLGSQGNPKIDLNFPLAIQPRIDSLVSFSDFTPGANIVIGGAGFGSKPGALVMAGLLGGGNNLTALPYIGAVALQIVSWNNTLIAANIPSYLTGVVDQQVKFYVLMPDKKTRSNDTQAVNFVAAREVVKLGPTDPAVALVSCGTDSNSDYCNGWIDPNDSGTDYVYYKNSTFNGTHLNCWACVGDDVGSDVYRVKVANGWVLDHIDWYMEVSALGEASAQLTTPFPAGGSSWQASVDWMATSDDWVSYAVDVVIVGPRGVPHH